MAMFANTDTSLASKLENGVEFPERKGVWWPLDMAEEQFGKQKPEHYVYRGEGSSRRVGIVKDSKHGTPDGTAVMEVFETTSVAKTQGHGNKSTEGHDGQLDNTWATMAKGMASVTAGKKRKATDSEGNVSEAIVFPQAKGKAKSKSKAGAKKTVDDADSDSSSEQDFLGIFRAQAYSIAGKGTSMEAVGEGNEDGGDGGGERNTGPSTGKKRKKPTTPSPGGASSSSKKLTPARSAVTRKNQMQRTSDVIRSVESTIDACLSSSLLKTYNHALVASYEKKLTERADPKLIMLYTDKDAAAAAGLDFTSPSESEGQGMVDKILELLPKIKACMMVTKALAAKDEASASSFAMQKAIDMMEDCKMAPPLIAFKVLLERKVCESWKDRAIMGHLDQLILVLDGDVAEDSRGGLQVGLWSLPKENVAEVQTEIIADKFLHIFSDIRAAKDAAVKQGDKDAQEDFSDGVAWAAVCSKIPQILDEGLAESVKHISVLLEVATSPLVDSDKVYQALQHFKNKSVPLFKPMTLYGGKLSTMAASWIESSKKDKAFKDTLDDLGKMIQVTDANINTTATWATVRARFTDIVANGSARLQEQWVLTRQF